MSALRITRFDGVCLAATSSYLPAEVVTTAALAAAIGADAAELERLTGVVERRVAPPEEATSDLVVHALAPLVTPEIDRLIVATVTPDHPSPRPRRSSSTASACRTCRPTTSRRPAPASSTRWTPPRAVATGDRAVLVGAAECRVRTLTRATPGVRVLFGDGAGGARVSTEHRGLRLLATGLGADGAGHAAVRVEAGGSRLPASEATVAAGLHALRMEDGAHVFMKATESFVALADDFLGALGLPLSDVALVVPHQPNVRILERLARLVRLPRERLVITCDRFGNVGGASVAIALDHALARGRIHPGDRILLLTAGAGYTAGAALLEAV